MQTQILIKNLNLHIDKQHILKNINVEIPKNKITVIIGPSGCGKTTLLKCLNRLVDLYENINITGSIIMDNEDILHTTTEITKLRQKMGLLSQRPYPLPMSIYKNMAFPLKLAGVRNQAQIEERVEAALKEAFLWNEVKDRLSHDARSLSGGQQQRLCIARALIIGPELMLLDEPTSSLDARAAAIIEELILLLKKRCTVFLVSHHMEQVARLADTVMALEDGTIKPV